MTLPAAVRRTGGRRALMGASAAALLAVSLAGPATAGTGTAPPVTPLCAWGERVSADSANVFFPDSAASYWVLPFTVQDGLRIRLSGRYPDSRYASFGMYKDGGGLFTVNGVPSALTDYQIGPRAGSVNPWRRPAAPGGRYTITAREDVGPGQANTLPLAPAGTADGSTGYLVFRVYAPAGGDFRRVPLPAVTFDRNGVSRTVPPCRHVGDVPTPAGAPPRSTADSGKVPFARPAAGQGRYPNADSAYLAALYTPAADHDVVVIRGKAPRSSSGQHPSPWPATGKDMRYWSVCTNLNTEQRPVVVNRTLRGTTDYGCRDDDQTKLDSAGRYTYIIGTEHQRAAIEKIPGATFLPFSRSHPRTQHVILLRNMLVNPGFAQAVQNVPDSDPASAAAVMGPYYPAAVSCPLRTVTRTGPESCFRRARTHRG